MNNWKQELSKTLNEMVHHEHYVLGKKFMDKALFHKWINDNLTDPEQIEWAHDWVSEM